MSFLLHLAPNLFNVKKIIVLFSLLVSIVSFAQSSEKKVWDLLLANKRTEARKLFDKDLKSKKDSNVDYLILDAILEIEFGAYSFDETFSKAFSKFPESKYYYTALSKAPFLLDDIAKVGFDDNTYKKIDFLASHPNFKNDSKIIYSKAVADRNRKDNKGFADKIKELNVLNDWQFCGVFENLNDSGIDIEYEPESYPKSDKLFDANSNGKVGWYIPSVKHNEGYQMFENESEYGNGILYAQTFIDNPIERPVYLNFGAGSSVKIFLNDVEIYVNNQMYQSDQEAYKLKVLLPKGTNRLLVKAAITTSTDYIVFSITDMTDHQIDDLTSQATFKQYNKSTLEVLNPLEVGTMDETYIIDKIKTNPDHVLYKVLLFETYMHNKKFELAHDIIEELDLKYPNSSFLKVNLATYYSQKGDDAKSQEIIKNLDIQDPSYYFNILMKIQDQDWLRAATIDKIEKLRDDAKSFRTKTSSQLLNIIIDARNNNIDGMVSKVDSLIENSNNSEFYITTFAPMYDQLLKDKTKTINLLENLAKNSENYEAFSQLKRYYTAANKKDVVRQMVLDRKNRYPHVLDFGVDYIDILIEEKNYDEALSEIDTYLQLFPYSFSLMEKKGMAFNSKSDLKQAEKYFRQSLSHHSSNARLRKVLYDVTKVQDEIELVRTTDVYKYIKDNRKSKMKSDYGVCVLLDEYLVSVLPEGGRKYRSTIVYEITAENGIEELKEYSLETYSVTLFKSEIVKPDGSVVPAENGGDQLVFTNLAVGDVIYLDYEYYENPTGRFYKDFNLSYGFNGSYPSLKSTFGIISQDDLKYKVDFNNGIVIGNTKKLGTKKYQYWSKNNTESLPLINNYAPQYSDIRNVIRVGTITSWKEVANWYADLVKKNLKLDKITQETFNQIFPTGLAGISEEQKAQKIYKYIEDNVNYSSLDFRQSGYVPQKPSKTITTKLGDCKDVSTLFVALGDLAGIKSNLVLVLTSDNGYSALKLPGLGFNHCIVKVQLDNKEYFLELTDKYLPFKAMPMSLVNASALIVSFDKAENEVTQLISLSENNAIVNASNTKVVMNIGDNAKDFVVTQNPVGSIKSFYNELFSNSYTDDVRKKKLEEDINTRLAANIVFESAKVLENDLYGSSMIFETRFAIPERLQSVGSLKISSIPFLDKVYTRNIIEENERNYEIAYAKYENCKEYNSEIIMNIAEGKKFAEIPENKTLIYKQHKYEITFELLKPNSLKINRNVKLSWDNIKKEDYAEFKKYVEDVIEIEKQIVGFK